MVKNKTKREKWKRILNKTQKRPIKTNKKQAIKNAVKTVLKIQKKQKQTYIKINKKKLGQPKQKETINIQQQIQKITKTYKKQPKNKLQQQLPKPTRTTTNTTPQTTNITNTIQLTQSHINHYEKLLKPIITDNKLREKITQHRNLIIRDRIIAKTTIYATTKENPTPTQVTTLTTVGILLEEEPIINYNLIGKTGNLNEILQNYTSNIKARIPQTKGTTWTLTPTGSNWTITNITTTYNFA